MNQAVSLPQSPTLGADVGDSRSEPVAGSAERVKLDQQPNKLELTHEEQKQEKLKARIEELYAGAVQAQRERDAQKLKARIEELYAGAVQAQQEHDAACRQLIVLRSLAKKRMLLDAACNSSSSKREHQRQSDKSLVVIFVKVHTGYRTALAWMDPNARCPTVAQILMALQEASIGGGGKQASPVRVRVIRPANLAQKSLCAAAAHQHSFDLTAVESFVKEGYFLMRHCAGVPQFIVELSDDDDGGGTCDGPPRFIDNGLGSSFLFDLFATEPSHWLVQRLDAILG